MIEQRYRANYGAGKVHYGKPCERVPFLTILACSGRAVEGCVPTDTAATCKACIKRQGS